MLNYTFTRYTEADGAEIEIKRHVYVPVIEAEHENGISTATNQLKDFFIEWEKMEKEYKKAMKNDERIHIFFYNSNDALPHEDTYTYWSNGRHFSPNEYKEWNDGKPAKLIELFAQVEQEL